MTPEVQAFLDHLKQKAATPGTIANYRGGLIHFWTWFSRDDPPGPGAGQCDLVRHKAVPGGAQAEL